MESWDIYDENRVKTGQTMERGSAFPSGAYHLVVHVCVFNPQGQMLIQQRQPFKEGWPDKWDLTVGGSAVAGDSSRLAAERETFEEIGYKLDLSGIRPHFSVNFEVGFDDYFLVDADIEIDKLRLQYEEVKQAKWASKNEILAMINSGEFIPYHKSLIEMCFEMRGTCGAVKNGWDSD